MSVGGGRAPGPDASGDRRRPIRDRITAIVTIAEAFRFGVISNEVVVSAFEALHHIRHDAGVDAEDVLASLVELKPGALEPVKAHVERLLADLLREPPPGGVNSAIPNEGRGEAERYRDSRYIGHGGMGVVYSAYDPVLDRRVALKFMRVDDPGTTALEPPTSPLQVQPGPTDGPTGCVHKEMAKRFLREARITGRIQHPAVLPIYEIGTTKHGLPYYAMELLPSRETLADVILPPEHGTIEDRLRLLNQFLRICDAIGHAHGLGIVHRDLKPQNIGLVGPSTAYVLDWGLAKRVGDVAEERPGAGDPWGDERLETQAGWFGTLGYVAPEHAGSAHGAMDSRMDVFSLGVVLFQILTGRFPYAPRSFLDGSVQDVTQDTLHAMARDADVPPGLAQIVVQALDLDPELRFPDAKTLARVIRVWLRQRSAEQEADGLLAEARIAIREARGLTGRPRLRAVDQGLAAIRPEAVVRLRGREAEVLQGELERLQDLGFAEEGRSGRQHRLTRLGALTLVVLVLVGLVAAVRASMMPRDTVVFRGPDGSFEIHEIENGEQVALVFPDGSRRVYGLTVEGLFEHAARHLEDRPVDRALPPAQSGR